MPENIVREEIGRKKIEIGNWKLEIGRKKLEIRELRVQGPRLAEGHVGICPPA